MSRSLLTGILITLLVFAGLSFLFYYNYIRVKSVPAVDAVPNSAALFFEIKNSSGAFHQLAASSFWKDFSSNESVNEVHQKMLLIDSVFNSESGFKDMVNDNKMVVSFHGDAGTRIHTLFILEADGDLDLSGFYQKHLSAKGYTFSKRTYEKQTIYDVFDNNRSLQWSVCQSNKLLIISENTSLLEEAIRKLQYKITNNTKGYEECKTLSNINSDVSLYVNYQQMPLFMNVFSKTERLGAFNYLRSFANWSLLDVKLSQDQVGLSGITITDDSVFQFLDLFKTQAPAEMHLQEMLPKNTAFAIDFGFTDYTRFNADLTEYLQSRNKLDEYIAFTDSIESLFGIELSKSLLPLIGSEALFGVLEPTTAQFTDAHFAMIKFTDNAAAQAIFDKFLTSIRKRSDDSVFLSQSDINARRLVLGNFLKLFYGGVFESIQSPYFALVNDVFLFANTKETIQLLSEAIATNNLLGSDKKFEQVASSTTSGKNVWVMMNPSRAFHLPDDFFNEYYLSAINRNQFDVKKFEYITLQYASTGNQQFYTHLTFSYLSSSTSDSRYLWSTKLDTTLSGQPSMVYDLTTSQNAFLLQDVLNNLYFIDYTGAIKWKNKLSGSMMGKAVSLRDKTTGRYTYLLQTEKQLYQLDENGANVLGFPIRFPGKAIGSFIYTDINSDSVEDVFVPLDNSRIAGYTVKGKSVKGWNPKITEEKVSADIHFFDLGTFKMVASVALSGKLLCYQINGNKQPIAGTENIYIKGNVHFYQADTSTLFMHFIDSSGAFVSAQIQHPDDSIVIQSKVPLGVSFTQNLFVGGVEPMMLVVGGFNMHLFDHKGRTVFTQTYSDSLPVIRMERNKSQEIEVHYLSNSQAKLYRYNQSATLYPQFPIEAVGNFAFCDFMMDGSTCLIYGTSSNSVNLIRLK